MLNQAERYEVVKVFKIISSVGQIPYKVDLNNWQLEYLRGGKQWICAASFILYILNVTYKCVGLALSLLVVPNVALHELILHACMAIPMLMCVFWYSYLFIWNPSLFATYFSSTLRGSVGGSLGPDDLLRTRWATRIGEYSMQDLIAISMPYIVAIGMPPVIAADVYDPSMRLLLYAGLPTGLQTWAMFGLCTVMEVWYLVVSATIAVPIWQLQVIAFDHVSTQLKRLMLKIQNGTHSPRSVYTILRSLQLYVSMVNDVNSYLIFTWKLLSISMGIVNGYAAIAHFREYPIFGVMYYVILFNVIIIYTIVYEKAFKIPQLFGRAAGCSLLHLRGYRCDSFKRQIQSIPRTGIKVGSFHTMERASTLIYLDFVLRNVVGMLVAYG